MLGSATALRHLKIRCPHHRDPRRRSCHSPHALRDLRPGEITTDWAREFFMPEEMDPARVHALGDGLHQGDGVSLIPMSAKLDLRKGSEADILIFRRGAIDAAFMDANPKLKLIQRLGARADAIDLAAAAKRGILVSCVPRATLQLTAEHAILLMLALGKRLLEADDAVRKDRWDRDRVRPDHNVAYNWAGIPNIGGLFNKTLGIIGLGEVGAITAGMARAFGMRVLYCNRNRLPAEQEEKLDVQHAELSAPARRIRFRVAARNQHSVEPRTDRREGVRRDEADRVLHQYGTRPDRRRGRTPCGANERHHRRRRARRAHDRAASAAGQARGVCPT